MNNLLTWLPKVSNRHFFFADTIVFLITPFLALLMYQGQSLDWAWYIQNLAITTVLFLGIKLALLHRFGFYKHYWRYASIDELLTIAVFTAAVIVLQLLFIGGVRVLAEASLFVLPRSFPILDGLLSAIFIAAMRFSVRASSRIAERRRNSRGTRTLIVGAGQAGTSLVDEMRHNLKLGFEPIAFIDDDACKAKLKVRGLPILGDRHSIPEVVEAYRIEKIIIAMPTAAGQAIREIAEMCRSTGVATSTLPGYSEILNNQAGVRTIREIQIEDLLRREPIQTDIQEVAHLLRNKRVLITGAGGSIGSELCRQILRCQPAELVLLGKGENSIFLIEQELNQLVQTLQLEDQSEYLPKIRARIADIRSHLRVNHIFQEFRPDIVFHAAAHKHVPLMELNSPEAITSNVLGTRNLINAALQHKVNHFVMISTDKAVNPTSVMGASKRVAEMLVLQAAKAHNKPYVVVRFGNVLGSRGSVLPTFKQQIARGGPITITHPEICRYFMTIPEAVQLVLQAAVLGYNGEVCMLDMGKPVKIVDLAEDLIRLSGYEVGKDIEVIFTGLRPGEKLYEELFIAGEQYERTQHDKILIVKNASNCISEDLALSVERLYEVARYAEDELIRALLKKLVPEYTPTSISSPTARKSDRSLAQRQDLITSVKS